MLFNSLDFAVFLPLVFLLYWFVFHRSVRLRNAFLIAASYFFYGWWDWRFLFLIVFSTAVDYLVALRLGREEAPARRKALLWTSVAVNIGFLGFFKYYNFFAENFVAAFTFFGASFSPATLHVVLPVGISFYTFQTLSYTIDVYKGKLEPSRDPVAYAAFVSFFPQLVAGPIERATNLLPQFMKARSFHYGKAVDGLRQMLWGFFQKVVIADNCAVYVNEIFARSGELPGSTLVLGAVLFAFQIYGDFAGYSNIAIGTARLFGFDLMQNFAFPYFSRDIAEFWRRWHISLSTWFRDYLYIPLGGSRVGDWKKIRNTFVIFVVSGFWHGAAWTFIAWGFLNALYFLPLFLAEKNRKYLDVAGRGRLLPGLREAGSMAATFGLTVFGWIFFRAESLSHAFSYIGNIFSATLFTMPGIAMGQISMGVVAALIAFMLSVEWMARGDRHGLETVAAGWRRPLRWAFYYAILILIIRYAGPQQEFIYFQF
ncbi:MAG: MBOAT family O-acyltransferase [Balneolaceae bacterium]|nr:MBOAT family O-acyltransferase [Balneolaceae bacterium]